MKPMTHSGLRATGLFSAGGPRPGKPRPVAVATLLLGLFAGAMAKCGQRSVADPPNQRISPVGRRLRRSARHGYRWRQIGENLAAGPNSVKQVVSGWLSSPEHCANIMNPHFTEMGAAYALNPKSDSISCWAQVFGRPR